MIRQTSAQALGARGEQWFPAQLPKYWYFQRPTYDLGVDGVVVIAEQNELNGIEFRVQIKSSQEWDRQDNVIVVRGIKRSTARYWAAGSSPTLLVFYDERADAGFCAWALDVLPAIPDLFRGDSETISLRAASPVSIDEHCWDEIRTALASRLNRLSHALQSARLANVILPHMREIACCIQLLHFREFTPNPEAQHPHGDMTLALGQAIAHRDIVRAAQRVLQEFDPQCLFARQLAASLAAYKNRVAEFYLGFDDLVAQDGSVAIRENELKAKELRPEMIQRATDLIMNVMGLWKRVEP